MYDFTLVDAHVHPFIDPANNICHYPSSATAQDMVDTLKASGVTLCCGSVIVPGAWLTQWELVAKCNAEAFEFAEMFPGFVIPGIHFHASFPEKSCEEIEKYYKTGMLHWIGEIVPYSCCTNDYSVKSLYPVYQLLSEYALPLNLHTSAPEQFDIIAGAFPKLQIVMAHPGEKRDYLAKLELMKKHPNIHLDVSGTGLFRWGMLKYGVQTVGAERFLYGSDFPVCDPAMNIAGVLSENLGDEVNQLIFSGNFRRLTGL